MLKNALILLVTISLMFVAGMAKTQEHIYSFNGEQIPFWLHTRNATLYNNKLVVSMSKNPVISKKNGTFFNFNDFNNTKNLVGFSIYACIEINKSIDMSQRISIVILSDGNKSIEIRYIFNPEYNTSIIYPSELIEVIIYEGEHEYATAILSENNFTGKAIFRVRFIEKNDTEYLSVIVNDTEKNGYYSSQINILKSITNMSCIIYGITYIPLPISPTPSPTPLAITRGNGWGYTFNITELDVGLVYSVRNENIFIDNITLMIIGLGVIITGVAIYYLAKYLR